MPAGDGNPRTRPAGHRDPPIRAQMACSSAVNRSTAIVFVCIISDGAPRRKRRFPGIVLALKTLDPQPAGTKTARRVRYSDCAMDCGKAIAVDIGGLEFHYVAGDGELRAMLRDRYRNFLTTPSSPSATLVLEVAPAAGDQAELDVKASGSSWRIARGDFVAEWHPETRTGHVRQSRNPYSTDSVTRIVCSFLLGAAPGFLLHASSLVWNGRAYVFCGPSGAGKTTMTGLAPDGARLLTDEISCLRRVDGVWRAFGTPFAGELATSGERISAPVAALFRLHHGDAHRVDPLSGGAAVRAIMRNVLLFGHDATSQARALDAVCELTASVPTARLSFRPEPSVWTHVA